MMLLLVGIKPNSARSSLVLKECAGLFAGPIQLAVLDRAGPGSGL